MTLYSLFLLPGFPDFFQDFLGCPGACDLALVCKDWKVALDEAVHRRFMRLFAFGSHNIRLANPQDVFDLPLHVQLRLTRLWYHSDIFCPWGGLTILSCARRCGFRVRNGEHGRLALNKHYDTCVFDICEKYQGYVVSNSIISVNDRSVSNGGRHLSNSSSFAEISKGPVVCPHFGCSRSFLTREEAVQCDAVTLHNTERPRLQLPNDEYCFCVEASGLGKCNDEEITPLAHRECTSSRTAASPSQNKCLSHSATNAMRYICGGHVSGVFYPSSVTKWNVFELVKRDISREGEDRLRQMIPLLSTHTIAMLLKMSSIYMQMDAGKVLLTAILEDETKLKEVSHELACWNREYDDQDSLTTSKKASSSCHGDISYQVPSHGVAIDLLNNISACNGVSGADEIYQGLLQLFNYDDGPSHHEQWWELVWCTTTATRLSHDPQVSQQEASGVTKEAHVDVKGQRENSAISEASTTIPASNTLSSTAVCRSSSVSSLLELNRYPSAAKSPPSRFSSFENRNNYPLSLSVDPATMARLSVSPPQQSSKASCQRESTRRWSSAEEFKSTKADISEKTLSDSPEFSLLLSNSELLQSFLMEVPSEKCAMSILSKRRMLIDRSGKSRRQSTCSLPSQSKSVSIQEKHIYLCLDRGFYTLALAIFEQFSETISKSDNLSQSSTLRNLSLRVIIVLRGQALYHSNVFSKDNDKCIVRLLNFLFGRFSSNHAFLIEVLPTLVELACYLREYDFCKWIDVTRLAYGVTDAMLDERNASESMPCFGSRVIEESAKGNYNKRLGSICIRDGYELLSERHTSLKSISKSLKDLSPRNVDPLDRIQIQNIEHGREDANARISGSTIDFSHGGWSTNVSNNSPMTCPCRFFEEASLIVDIQENTFESHTDEGELLRAGRVSFNDKSVGGNWNDSFDRNSAEYNHEPSSSSCQTSHLAEQHSMDAGWTQLTGETNFEQQSSLLRSRRDATACVGSLPSRIVLMIFDTVSFGASDDLVARLLSRAKLLIECVPIGGAFHRSLGRYMGGLSNREVAQRFLKIIRQDLGVCDFHMSGDADSIK